jgi:hypothetical protein
MPRYEGLLLDFGGVVTTDFLAALGAHCERLGLPTTASATSKWNAES